MACTVSQAVHRCSPGGKNHPTIAPIVGGQRRGGKPDNARGGGKEVAKLTSARQGQEPPLSRYPMLPMNNPARNKSPPTAGWLRRGRLALAEQLYWGAP